MLALHELPCRLQASVGLTSWESGMWRRSRVPSSRSATSAASRSISRLRSGNDGSSASYSSGGETQDIERIEPTAEHKCTIIYLFNDGQGLSRFLEGHDKFPHLRVVLVDAQQLDLQKMEKTRSWRGASRSRRVGDFLALEATRRTVGNLVEKEVDHVGDGQRVFLGGHMQGCTLALDIYLREARRLNLGGFVGSGGFIPADKLGFEGASQAMEALAADPIQSHRPVWLQCATVADDREYAPWRSVVKPSLARPTGILPGLMVREVPGRGSTLAQADWETNIVHDFMHEHVPWALLMKERTTGITTRRPSTYVEKVVEL